MTKNKRIILTILLLLGYIVTGCLIHIYYKANFLTDAAPSFCSVSSLIDCDGVAKTNYAFFLGVPLAIWGAILYTILLFLTYVDKINEKLKTKFLTVFKNPKSYIAAIACFSFAVSMVLACIQFFKIGKICYLCFITYFIDLAIALVAKGEGFFYKDIKNTVLDFIEGAKRYLPLFLIVCFLSVWALTWFQTSLVLAPNMKLVKSFEEFQKLKTNIYAVKGNTLGNPEGSIVAYVYSDFMCPFCKVTNTMVHKLAKENKDLVVYHVNFPLDTNCNPALRQMIHPGACLLARYALAAEKQGAYWDMANAIYDTQPLNEKSLLAIGVQIGVDVKQLEKDANSPEIAEELAKQIQRSINFGIQGTPTIVIDGIEHKSALPYYQLKTLVKQARNRHKHQG